MNCVQCGEVCGCPVDSPPPAFSQWEPGAGSPSGPPSSLVSRQETSLETHLIDAEALDLSEEMFAASLDVSEEGTQEPGSAHAAGNVAPVMTAVETSTAGPVPTPPDQISPDEAQDSAWRDEISVRLSRYRARRKMHPPRYPSLSLPFAPLGAPVSEASPNSTSPSAGFKPVSDQALALEAMIAKPPTAAFPAARFPLELSAAQAAEPVTSSSGASGAKILEFPKLAWGPPLFPADQLAEPVSDGPRILEVPEVAPPPPALGGITIEAAERQEAEKRSGIDIPMRSASLARRVLASAIDGLIIALASVMGGFIFWRVTAIRPPRIQILGLAAGIPSLLWAAYQYLMTVYGASTPGLRAAGLGLFRFDGTSANRSLRRWRVLAAFLSAASLGMGYVWVLLDEDALCWHDRITRTHLAPRKRSTGEGTAR